MSFQVCINTDKSLRQLATEIRKLLFLPPFQEMSSPGTSYAQFEMLGMTILLRYVDEEERDPEVKQYPYSFDLQCSFSDHRLDTDMVEYQLQPYYAQLLSFKLGIETAYREQKKVEQAWKIRYRFCRKNQNWNENILFGEPGWQPAVFEETPGPWRNLLPHL